MKELIEPRRGSYDVIYQPSAQDDLDNIAIFYAKTADLDVAVMILERIEIAVNTLETMPERCKAVDFDAKGRDIRRLLVPKTPIVVYFEVIASTVYLLKIEHGKADQGHLPDFLATTKNPR